MAFIPDISQRQYIRTGGYVLSTQNARPGPVPIIGERNGQTWSKSRMRDQGRFGYAGSRASNRVTLGLVPRQGLDVWTEPLDYVSPWKTGARRTYRGYSGVGVVSPEVFDKPTNWGAIGLGVGVFASTAAASMLVHGLLHKGVTPGWKGAMPAILPAMGAGFVAYLLRWNLDKLCACPKAPKLTTPEFEQQVVGESPPPAERPVTQAHVKCPEGSVFNPETGQCEYGLI